MKIEELPIEQIKPNPDNPRTIKDEDFKRLVESIRLFPKMLKIRPIVINAENIVLGGNMRLKAAQAAGLTVLPVIRATDLTPEEQKEFIIKDNVSGGVWNWEQLANEWNVEELVTWGLDIPEMKEPEELEKPKKTCPNCGHEF